MSLYKYLTRIQLSPTPVFTNTLYETGYNNTGQLGNGTTANKSSPTQLGTSSWTQVAGGVSHTSAIRSDGKLFTWGLGTSGQLGDSTLISKSSPVQVGTSSWSLVSVGDLHTLAIKKDGTLWGWGDNSQGQVGIAFANMYSWTQLTTGWGGFLGIRTDGTLWSWGNNSNGQLGDSTIVAKSSPIQVGTSSWSQVSLGYYNVVAIKSDNTLWAWGQNNYGQMGDSTVIDKSSPVQIGASSWTQISNGTNHTGAIRADGTLWTWGYNGNGQLANSYPFPNTSWTTVAQSGYHSLGIRTDGTLWAWGLNDNGQLGDVTVASKSSPVQIGSDNTWTKVATMGNASMALKSNGTLWTWGYNGEGQLGDGTTANKSSPVQIGSGTTWSKIFGGNGFSSSNKWAIAIKTDGSLWAWGYNPYGQLGDGTTANKSSPTQIGTSSWTTVSCSNLHTLAIRSDGLLFAWGANDVGGDAGTQGYLGNNSNANKSSPVQIGSNSWIAISATSGWGYDGSGASSAAIRSDGTLWAWGSNSTRIGSYRLGDSGNSRSSPVQVGTDTDWTTVNLGFEMSFGTKTNNSLWWWGLGNSMATWFSNSTKTISANPQKFSDSTDYSLFTFGASGEWYSQSSFLAIRSDGCLAYLGYNNYGNLGNGFSSPWYYPSSNINTFVGDNRYNMDNKSSPVQVGTANNWSQIKCGDNQTIALKSDGSLWMWGYNVYGNLGDGTTISRSSPTQIGTSSWAQIGTGTNHTLAIKADGTLWGWGYNSTGQVGLVNTGTAYSWTQISAGTNYNMAAIRSDGTLWAWGENTQGQIGDNTVTQRNSPVQIGAANNWSQIKTATYMSEAIKTDGSLWQWGFDSLNLGFIAPSFISPQYSWSQVSAGYYYTLAIRSDGKLFAWGYNAVGSLSDGTTNNKSSPVQIGTSSSWTQVVTSAASTRPVNFAIRSDGALFSWGDNTYGQLGDGTFTSNTSFVRVGTSSWSQVSISASHVLALRSDNTLWAWGVNTGGQLGINTSGGMLNSPVQVGTSFVPTDSSANNFTINSYAGGVMGSNLTPFSTGSSLYFPGNGYLLVDNVANNAAFVMGTNDFTIEFWYYTYTLNTQSIIFDQRAQGVNGLYPTIYKPATNQIVYFTNGADRITSGNTVTSNTWYHVAVSRSGSSTKLFVNGVQEGSTYTDTTSYINGYNRPAIGVNAPDLTTGFVSGYMSNIRVVKGTAVYTSNFTPSTSPLTAITNTTLLINSFSANANATTWTKIAAGISHSAAIRSDGGLFTWGTDSYGALGADRWTAHTVYSWSQVATGYGTTLAIRSDGKLFAWGYNDQANIGDGTTDSNNRKSSPVQIGTSNWSQVATALYHSLAIRADGTLWTWGVNGQGQCGQGNTIGYSSPVQIGTSSWTQIDAGEQFSVGIKADGTLWTWGYNPNGQLGDGTTASKSSPIQVGTSSWSLVSAGEHVITAISSTGKLFTWGQNVFGQLGDGTTASSSSPVQIGTSSWTQVSVGYSHVAAIRTDGTLWSWGLNSSGQLGQGDYITRSSPVQIGTESNWTQVASRIASSIGLKSDGSLWAWGLNTSGELGGNYPYNSVINYPVKVNDFSWTKIGSGKTNQWNMAIRSDGLLFGWGYNAWGQLGVDNTTNKTSGPVQIPDNTLLNRSSPVQVGTSSWSQIYTNPTSAMMAAIRSDGTLWTWGRNDYGQLGDGTTNPKSSPTQIGSANNWAQVILGSGTYGQITVAKKTDGSLWTWGYDDNSNGFLGVNGSVVARSSPVQVFSHASWSNVTAGYDHFIYTQTDGSLWARGGNTYGQYGSNNTLGYWNSSNPYTTLMSAAANFLVLNRSSPVQVGTSSWSSISLGLYHTLALRSDGALFTWGNNGVGQLGNGTMTNQSSPTQIGTSSWTQIAAGTFHSTAIRSDGALFTWGDNNYNKLGYANYSGVAYSWTQIAGSSLFTLGIRSDGTLWSWGYNNYGQLGQGDINARSSPVQIGSSSWISISCGYDYTAIAVRSDGTLWSWGRNDYGQVGDSTIINRSIPIQIGSSNTWSKVATSGYHSMALKSDSSLWTWGYNLDGRLGNLSEFVLDSSANYSWTQITASRLLTFAIKSDGTLWGTGINDQGQQLFSPRYYRGDNFQDSMVQFGTSSWTQVDTGWAHVMAIDINGALWGWGYGQQGQIGTGTPTNYYVMTKVGNSSWTQVSAGGMQSGPGVNDLGSTMAIRADGTLWAWGHNAGGEVGNGTVVSQSSPVQIGTSSWTSISMGSNSAAAVRADGTLWAWGYNFGGELGQNDIIPRSSPVQIGAGTNWSKVSVGAAYTLALKTDGSLWAWGYNNYGQLGFNDIISRSSPVQVGLSSWTNINAGAQTASAIKADGTFWSWGYNGTYQINVDALNKSSPVQVGSNTNWSQIANGENHSVALDSNGIVYTWGTNSYGQTGISTAYTNYRPTKLGVYSAFVNRSSPVQVGTSSWTQISTYLNSSAAIRSDGLLFTWGYNLDGQLGDGTVIAKSSPVQIGANTWTSISVGTSTMSAIRSDGLLFSWGYNTSYGQVGDNTTINRSSPVQISANSWTSVSVGAWMSAAVKLDGSIWVWGRDQEGYQQQLGQGNKNYSSPVQIGQGGNVVWSKVSMGNNFNALAIRSDGLLFGWGYNGWGNLGVSNYPQYRMVLVGNNTYYNPKLSPTQVGTSSWSVVSASDNHTMAIRSDGILFGWGYNNWGQLGDNSYIDKDSPVQIGTKTWSNVYAGYARTLATDTAGITYGWGDAGSNRLLDNGPTTIIPVPRYIQSFTKLSINAGAGAMAGIIKPDGTLWLTGTNSNGQQGQGNVIDPLTGNNGISYPLLQLGNTDQINSVSSPVQIGTSSWSQVSATQNESMAIRADGTLWSWGQNNYGQLGLISAGVLDTNYRSSPMQIGTESNWAKIKMGYLAAGAIRTNGTAQIWGYGGAGEQADLRVASRYPHELGDFYHTVYSSPVQIGAGSWIKISAGQYENMAINSANNLFSWGRNVNFGLGDGTNVSRSSAVQVGTSSWTMVTIRQNGVTTGAAAGITTDNKLFAWGGYNSYGQQLTKNSGTIYSWTQIAQGPQNGAAIRSDGLLFTWGINSLYGQLGIATLSSLRISPVQVGASSWSMVTVGNNHMVAIRQDKTLWAWGLNTSGELGVNYVINNSSPVQIGANNSWSQVAAGYNHTLATKLDGSLWAWGLGTTGQLGTGLTQNKSSPVQIGASSWNQVKAYGNVSAAIRSDGGLFTWGDNTNAQLGVLSYSGTPQSWTQMSIGDAYSTAIRSDGTLWTWGTVANLQYIDPARVARYSPVLIDSGSWKQIGSGSAFSIGIKSDGSLWGFGLNSSGQLGLGHVLNQMYSPTQIGANTNWTSVSVGYTHTLALRNDGALFAWGLGTNGQLGDGTILSKSSPVQIGTSSWTQIAAGVYGSSAIRSDGALFTWGYNINGQLGNSTVVQTSSPAQVGTSSWTQVAAGFYVTLGIKLDGTLWSWGLNTSGQLGDNTVVSKSSPVQVGSSTNWIEIAGGTNISFFRNSANNIYATGLNTSGQLGLGDILSKSSPVQVGAGTNWIKLSKSCGNVAQIGGAISANNALYVWGVNSDGRAGVGSIFNISTPTQIGGNYYWETKSSPVQVGTSSWTQVAIGLSQGAAIRADGTLWSWGRNTNGELGLNDRIDRSSPVQVGANTNWSQITIGDGQVYAIDNTGNLFAWGVNTDGRLGTNNLISRSNPTQVGAFIELTSANISVPVNYSGTPISSPITPLTDGTGSLLGGGSYLYTSPSPNYILNADFTLEYWFFSTDAGATFNDQFNVGTMAGGSGNGIGVRLNSSDSVYLNGQFGFVNDLLTLCPVQTWNHLAISRTGTTLKIFVNGTQRYTGTYTQILNSTGAAIYLFYSPDDARGFSGYLTNFRLINGTGLYTTNFTPTTTKLTAVANTVFLFTGPTYNSYNWSKVSSYSTATLGLTTANTMATWGVNISGSLVEGNFVTQPNIRIVGNTEVFVTSDTPNQILTSDTWKAVAIDYEGYSKAAIKTNGTLWTWGLNDAGQLGQGNAISRSSPVQVGVYNWSSVQMGYRHIAALRDNNYLFAWGNNANGQLGDGTVTNRNSPVIIGGAIANNQYQLIATGSVYNNFFLK